MHKFRAVDLPGDYFFTVAPDIIIKSLQLFYVHAETGVSSHTPSAETPYNSEAR
jgi:hypothetical protein